MSNVLYPCGLIEKVSVTPFNQIQQDIFEAGNSSTKLLWSAQNFKRTIKIQHAPLTLGEYRYLRSFYSQRSGNYDSFWFRDGPNRSGNYNVRFAAPVASERDTDLNTVQITLQEIAPIRQLPEFDELTTAAGTAPLAWYDANRARYWLHAGGTFLDSILYDSYEAYPGVIQAGTLPLGGTLAQYQQFAFDGTFWAKSSSNAALAGAQPACTLIAIARHSTTATKQQLFSVGATGGTHALGITLAADNRYEPWVGGTETWTNARFNNSAADTWRSIAAVWAASSNVGNLYVNAALVAGGGDTNTRSLTAGPIALGASPSGTLIANPSAAMANANLAHAIVIPAALTLAQIKAVHNLLGYQYGLSIVA